MSAEELAFYVAPGRMTDLSGLREEWDDRVRVADEITSYTPVGAVKVRL